MVVKGDRDTFPGTSVTSGFTAPHPKELLAWVLSQIASSYVQMYRRFRSTRRLVAGMFSLVFNVVTIIPRTASTCTVLLRMLIALHDGGIGNEAPLDVCLTATASASRSSVNGKCVSRRF